MRLLLDTLSRGSLWEIAIRHGLASADMPLSAREAIPWAEQSGFAFLLIELPQLLALEQRPFTLLSADAAFTAYGCPLQDARS
jgi:hypothetical protein